MKTKGKYFWKAQWYYICSKHRYYEVGCELCNCGVWRNVMIHSISSLVYDNYPEVWRWWVNTSFMRRFSKTSKFLRSTFPKLK